MKKTVMDSFAFLRFFFGESGAEIVKKILDEGKAGDRHLMMTACGWAEIKYMVLRKRGVAAWRAVLPFFDVVPVEVHPLDKDIADKAAELKSLHRLSLADAFAAELARREKAWLVTGDPEFKSVENLVRVIWI